MHTTARAAVVADMEAMAVNGTQLFDPEQDREDREIDLAHSDRSKTPIEPYLADQWFVTMDELAQSAMDAVNDGRVQIVPARYAKSYLDWLSEKRDWPVGRQLWWGHRIPVWHTVFAELDQFTSANAHITLARNELRAALGTLGVDVADYEFWAPDLEEHEDPKLFICARTPQADAAIASLTRAATHGKRSSDLRAVYDLTQDEEVLDTWFSSALWPHSTLGWPEHTPELATFYPTSALVTSRDIISLWVARMVLMGLFNMQRDGRSPKDAIPFYEVYITPKILDGYGETMSKSKGNGVDPLDVIEKFGADALRYGIAYLTTDTQDVKMPVEFECPHCGHLMAQTKKNRTLPRVECEKCKQPFSTQWAERAEDKALPRAGVSNERFELGRRFCNKLWNASRFSLMNLADFAAGAVRDADLLLEDRWILSRLNTVTREVTDDLEHYRFAEAARALYAFAWNDFCDYYVEITKARFKEPGQRGVAQRVLAHVLDSLVRLLHPMVPFLTEEVWQLLNAVAPGRGLSAKPQAAAESVCIAPWPGVEERWIDATIEEQFADFQAVLGAVREIRMAQIIPPRTPVEFRVTCPAATAKLLEPMQPYFAQIAESTCMELGPKTAPPERAVSKSLGEIDVHVDVSAFFDVDAEKARLTKEIANLRGHADSLEKKLANENFVSRAPADVVQQQRDKLVEVRGQAEAAEAALAKLA
jgi:valyl-tRNA synthetase